MDATTILMEQERQQTIAAFADHVSSGKVQFFSGAGVNFIPGCREGIYLWDIGG